MHWNNLNWFYLNVDYTKYIIFNLTNLNVYIVDPITWHDFVIFKDMQHTFEIASTKS